MVAVASAVYVCVVVCRYVRVCETDAAVSVSVTVAGTVAVALAVGVCPTVSVGVASADSDLVNVCVGVCVLDNIRETVIDGGEEMVQVCRAVPVRVPRECEELVDRDTVRVLYSVKVYDGENDGLPVAVPDKVPPVTVCDGDADGNDDGVAPDGDPDATNDFDVDIIRERDAVVVTVPCECVSDCSFDGVCSKL
eukprot:PhM_4_TR8286/c2_g3_i1/m.92637